MRRYKEYLVTYDKLQRDSLKRNIFETMFNRKNIHHKLS